jgi:signal transduction histidine kinase
MWDTGSLRSDRGQPQPELGGAGVHGRVRTDRVLLASWLVSAVVNVYLMWVLPGAETVPFHLVWIGISIIYGFTTWRVIGMSIVLTGVAVSTGVILVHHAAAGQIGWEETTEVPLMSVLFVVMVWHVRRRQQALAEVARLADNERRRAEVQQLFIRFASHELRTPITVARGYAELFRAGCTEQSLRDDAEIVIEELDKLARITQRLVTLMQVEGADQRRVGNVDAELARIARRWEPAADRVWSVRSTIGNALVNSERLEAALDCLLENAVKFTGPGDRIEVGGAADFREWTVTVSDTGAGMTAAAAAALTDGDRPLQRTASGTGLGLAIARAVATSWGGVLTVHSEPGHGTRVTIRVPWLADGPFAAGIDAWPRSLFGMTASASDSGAAQLSGAAARD